MPNIASNIIHDAASSWERAADQIKEKEDVMRLIFLLPPDVQNAVALACYSMAASVLTDVAEALEAAHL